MDHVAALIAVAALATAGIFGAHWATGGSATFSKAVCYAVGILVPMPLIFDIMRGLWPSRGRPVACALMTARHVVSAARRDFRSP
jgi:hypothetical protein